jgi:hypothetical protein
MVEKGGSSICDQNENLSYKIIIIIRIWVVYNIQGKFSFLSLEHNIKIFAAVFAFTTDLQV